MVLHIMYYAQGHRIFFPNSQAGMRCQHWLGGLGLPQPLLLYGGLLQFLYLCLVCGSYLYCFICKSWLKKSFQDAFQISTQSHSHNPKEGLRVIEKHFWWVMLVIGSCVKTWKLQMGVSEGNYYCWTPLIYYFYDWWHSNKTNLYCSSECSY